VKTSYLFGDGESQATRDGRRRRKGNGKLKLERRNLVHFLMNKVFFNQELNSQQNKSEDWLRVRQKRGRQGVGFRGG